MCTRARPPRSEGPASGALPEPGAGRRGAGRPAVQALRQWLPSPPDKLVGFAVGRNAVVVVAAVVVVVVVVAVVVVGVGVGAGVGVGVVVVVVVVVRRVS